MNLLYIFLTILMFVDCVLLVLLVLLQLPKKEAGAGMAFGGGATDALFGAGSGNVLTKITKWVAGGFFGLAVLMAVVSGHQKHTTGAESLTDALSKTTSAPAPSPTTTPAAAPSANNGLLQTPLLSNLPPAQTSTPAPDHAAKATAPVPVTNK